MQILNDFLSYTLNSISDSTQNPYSLLIFIIISALIISLALAIFSNKVKHNLIKLKILDHDESPFSFLMLIIAVLVIIKSIQAFVVQPFLVDGRSMLPTLKTHELLIINKLNSSIDNLQRGDVIVFRHVKNDQFDGKFFIKRLIGLPGDRVLVKNGVTTIFNKENENGITLDESFVSYTDTKNDADITLGKDEYFAMGDNRSESFDSRSWGVLHKKDIAGKPIFRLLPLSKIESDPGAVQINFIPYHKK